MLQKSGRLVLWEAMFILELHSAETQVKERSCAYLRIIKQAVSYSICTQKSIAPPFCESNAFYQS